MRSKYEIKAQKELEVEGYVVDYKPRSRFSFGLVDFFNRFDLLAVKKGESVRWISIKGHAGASKAHTEAIRSFWLPEYNQKEIWTWPNNKKKKQWIKKIIS